jgi:hypothetical protein
MMTPKQIINKAKSMLAADFIEMLEKKHIEFDELEISLIDANEGVTNIIPRIEGWPEGESIVFVDGEFVEM